jgi:hypothetical protein
MTQPANPADGLQPPLMPGVRQQYKDSILNLNVTVWSHLIKKEV